MSPRVVAIEHADAWRFLDAEAGGAEIIDLGAGLDLLRRERHREVVVEVAVRRRQPVEGPAHPLLERVELLQRRTRDRDQGGVARGKVRNHPLKTVGPERAAFAAFVPVGREHEVLHHELAAPLEQVGQRHLAVLDHRTNSLVDLDPGQCAALRAEAVAGTGKFLLMGEMGFSGFDPFLA